MTEQDIATRRARDLERYHRRVAERRAKGLCLKCGKRPPAPHRSQCEPCAEKRRPADLARHHRRSAERATQGLCPKCGTQPPAPGRSLCEPCAEKTNRASRARDARLRAAGMPRRDPERARLYERERSRQEAGERRAAGLCVRCGKAPAVEGGPVCEPCAETRRARERARYTKASAEGKLYGNAEKCLMPSDLQESADLRGFSTDSLGINPVSSLAAEDAHQTVLCTREGPGPDRWRRVDRKDFQFLGRAGMEVHFGGLEVCVAEPDRDLPDVYGRLPGCKHFLRTARCMWSGAVVYPAC